MSEPVGSPGGERAATACERACRSCGGRSGAVVLDLGTQPPCDYFPSRDDPGPDPQYPLQMWLCAGCGLAQLADDPTVAEEPRGAEPAALVAQARDAVGKVAAAGLLPGGAVVAEYGSPHGGSWLGLLADRGLRPTADGPADVIVDCFGLMHAADQREALAGRTARVAPGGVLLLQYHGLDAIIGRGQWNALRHGHYAYYSTTALAGMLATHGFSARTAWRFDLYGGTILLAARRDADGQAGPDDALRSLIGGDLAAGTADRSVLGGLQNVAREQASELRAWLVAQRDAGRTVLGYGAASRAVALLRLSGVSRELLPAIVDASPAKHGLRMPGTDIPIVGPGHLLDLRPDAVLLFLEDLRAEVMAAYPQIEAGGGRWVDAQLLSPAHGGSGGLQQGA